MGTWGAGNFQSDGTLDWLAGDVVKPLVETIESNIRGVDESNDQIVTAAVEVLAVLCEQLNAVPPWVDRILGWRAAYLRAWEGFIDAIARKSDYKARRREVIDRTFARLLAVAKQWHATPLRVDFGAAIPDQERAQIQGQLNAALAVEELGELTAGETRATPDPDGVLTFLTGRAFARDATVEAVQRAVRALNLRSAMFICLNDPADVVEPAWPDLPR
jgi:hypothetical protein